MEQISTMLPKWLNESERGFEQMTPQEYQQAKADAFNASKGDMDKQDGYNCDVCRNKGYIASVVYNESFGYYSESLNPCKCMKARDAIRKMQRSGLEDVVKKYTFQSYQTPDKWQASIKQTAMRFCDDDTNNWFFIGGQSGAGKTHICTAIAVRYIKRGKAARYMVWPKEIRKIQAMVNEADKFDALMRDLENAEVLYIDDLFKHGKDADGRPKAPSEPEVRRAFEIINYRCNKPDLVTIISTEKTLFDLVDIDEALGGRISEKTKDAGYCINLTKDSTRNWRLRGLGVI